MSALEHEILRYVDVGYSVERQTPDSAIIVKGHRPNHILHLILSVLTLGLWIPVWVCISVFGGQRRYLLTVGSDGAVRKSKAG